MPLSGWLLPIASLISQTTAIHLHRVAVAQRWVPVVEAPVQINPKAFQGCRTIAVDAHQLDITFIGTPGFRATSVKMLDKRCIRLELKPSGVTTSPITFTVIT